jgi:lipoprotein-anchoring transpeptidase ErfK/SrfK
VIPARRRVPRPVAAVACLALAAAAAACSSDGEDPLATVTPSGAVTDASTADDGSTVAGDATGPVLQRATPTTDDVIEIHGAPSSQAPITTALEPRTRLGSSRVLLATGERPGWVQVSVPARPNGATGWIRADQVTLEPVEGGITVDLDARRMRIVLDGEVLADTDIAVGTADNPTPTGRFYVIDRVEPETPDGAYGAFALGLSAWSPTLTDFGGGDGQVGIHGTDEPGSIGKAASHGCVRVPDDVAAILSRVPLGTPVVVE